MRPSRDRTELPETLGAYTVVEVLGQGGSGTVYRVRRGERELALKVLRPEQTSSERERRRWVEEAAHLGRVRHEGVVRIFEAGELDDGRPFLAMELLRGVTLADRVAAGALPLDLALRLFEKLASAVTAIHDAGLIHRDLKPENVMLAGDRVVVLDLGIARAADAPPSTTTQHGYQRGTPAVMAPERFFGERATVQSDVYELGVVLFVMVTGRLPWRAILDAQARMNPLRPSELGVALPPALEETLMRVLALEATARPASVAALAEEVRRAGWSGPTVPVPSHWPHGTAPKGPAAPGGEPRDPVAAANLDSGTRGAGAGRWVARAAILAGLALVATPLILALAGGVDGPGDGALAAGAPAGAAADTGPVVRLAEVIVRPLSAEVPEGAVAEPEIETSAAVEARLGGGAPAHAPASDDLDPSTAAASGSRTPRRPPPAAAGPQVPAAGSPPAAGATGAMPWCRKQAALYCTDEFKATEGALAGKLCTTMTEQVRTWEGLAPEASAALEATCKENYAALAAAARERIQFYRERIAPADSP